MTIRPGARGEGGKTETGLFHYRRVKILWYMVYRGDPVLQNSDVINQARMEVAEGGLKLEWKAKGGLGFLDLFFKKPFKSPFHWDLNSKDMLSIGKNGYPFLLQSGADHRGKPDTDRNHYWIILFEPQDSSIAGVIQNAIQAAN